MKKKNKSGKKQKSGNRKILSKAGIAMNNEFFLEAVWIISAVLEKRLKNILKRVELKNVVIGNLFDQNIKRIKHLYLTTGNPMLTEYFTLPMIDELRTWKNQRNEVMKDMLIRHISVDRMERLAGDGLSLLNQWNDCYKGFKSNFQHQGQHK